MRQRVTEFEKATIQQAKALKYAKSWLMTIRQQQRLGKTNENDKVNSFFFKDHSSPVTKLKHINTYCVHGKITPNKICRGEK